MNHSYKIFFWISVIFFLIPVVYSQKYEPHVWETHRYTGKIRSIQFTKTKVYVFCDYGIYPYDRFFRKWLSPITKNPVFGDEFLTIQPNDKPTLIDNFTLGLFTNTKYYEYNNTWDYWLERLPPNVIQGPDSIDLKEEEITHWIPPFGWTIMPDKKIVAPFHSWFNVRFAVTDERGDTWWNIEKLGLAVGNTITKKITFERLGPSENSIQSMSIDQKNLFIGGTSRGLSRFDRNTGQWNWYEPLQSGFEFTSGDIRAIQIKSNDVLVLATAHGVVIANGDDTRNWRNFNQTDGLSSNDVKDILVVENTIYVATGSGLDAITKDNKIKKLFSIFSYPISVYQLTRCETIVFAATSIGIAMIQTVGNHIAFIEGPSEFNSNHWTFVQSFNNELWCINTEGLAYYDRNTDQWTCWSKFHQLDGAQLTSLQVHPAYIWIGSNRGLYRLDRNHVNNTSSSPRFSPRIHHYTQENDGLISNQIYDLERDADTLWIGTNQGLTVFRFQMNGKIQE